MKTGGLVETEHLTLILLGAIVGFILIVVAFGSIKGKFSRKDILCELKICMNDNSVWVKAIIDTGNFLKEPITGTPVVVVEKQELYGIIPEQILDRLSQLVVGESVELLEYGARVRAIPFMSLGKENGMLVGIKVDFIVVNYEEKKVYVDNVIIGVYEGKLSKNGEYGALIGLEILDSGKEREHEYIRGVKV